MKIKKIQIISGSFLFIVLAIYFSLLSNSLNRSTDLSIIAVSQFIVIGLISVFSILKDSNPYSLNKMHWYFIMIFMVLAPFCQYSSGYYAWNYKVEMQYVEKANYIVLLWSTIYYVVYNCRPMIKVSNNTISNSIKSISKSEQIIMLILSLFASAIMVFLVGFSNLFSKETSFLSGGTFSILFNYLFRSIPPINAAILIKAKKRGYSISLIHIVIHLILTVLLNFPLALSRYWIGVIYIGLILCILPEKVFTGKKFDAYVLVGLLVLFPISYFLKKYSFFELIESGVELDIVGIYLGVDFDAHSMLCRIIEYVGCHGVMFGRQLLSVIFFFVPRTVLNIKGTPTGQLVATQQGSYYTNVSAPLMGEGYIDFGLIGVVLYACIFSLLLKQLDNTYWRNNEYLRNVDIITVFMIGFVLFVMRGALQPVFLRVMGFYLYLFMFLIIRRLRVKR